MNAVKIFDKNGVDNPESVPQTFPPPSPLPPNIPFLRSFKRQIKKKEIQENQTERKNWKTQKSSIVRR